MERVVNWECFYYKFRIIKNKVGEGGLFQDTCATHFVIYFFISLKSKIVTVYKRCSPTSIFQQKYNLLPSDTACEKMEKLPTWGKEGSQNIANVFYRWSHSLKCNCQLEYSNIKMIRFLYLYRQCTFVLKKKKKKKLLEFICTISLIICFLFQSYMIYFLLHTFIVLSQAWYAFTQSLSFVEIHSS